MYHRSGNKPLDPTTLLQIEAKKSRLWLELVFHKRGEFHGVSSNLFPTIVEVDKGPFHENGSLPKSDVHFPPAFRRAQTTLHPIMEADDRMVFKDSFPFGCPFSHPLPKV